jgi:peptide-N4-(N-acetyl-beta-glucosaminyl)asparagine amidase
MLNIFKIQNNAFNFPYTKDSFILYKQMARQYKDKDILAFVNRIVPSEIKEEIRIKENNKIQPLKPLLDWFKNDYMKWMDIKKKCQNCNMSIMHLNVFKGNSWRLRMIEVYECFNCNLKIVFPRYGEITKIADSRIGRCSEWSMLFGAILNSLSIETRIVQDYLDHCWNESLIDGKWINIDSTLEYPISINHPHYYEKNWSKKYKYILAFSHNSLEDVTSSYTQEWQIVLQRRRKDNKGRNRVEYFRKFYLEL